MSAAYTALSVPPRLAKRRRATRAISRGLVTGHYRMIRRVFAAAPAPNPRVAVTAHRCGGGDVDRPDEAAVGERGRFPQPSCAGPAPGPRSGGDLA